MEKTAKVELTVTDWNYIIGLISQRPIAEAVNLLFAVRAQVEQQSAAEQDAPAEAQA